MTDIDRRGLIKGAIATATFAAVAAPGPLFAIGINPDLFIFDGRLAQARTAALEYRAAGIPVLDRQEMDLGNAWRTHIPERLMGGAGRIAGMTLWVDSYICETFGRDLGLGMSRSAGRQGMPIYHWLLQ